MLITEHAFSVAVFFIKKCKSELYFLCVYGKAFLMRGIRLIKIHLKAKVCGTHFPAETKRMSAKLIKCLNKVGLLLDLRPHGGLTFDLHACINFTTQVLSILHNTVH